MTRCGCHRCCIGDGGARFSVLTQVIKKVVEGSPVVLVEALAENIASTPLDSYSRISEVTIRVTKPNPPVAIHFLGLSIEIQRKRMQERGI
ncbi:MAG: FolB domain-containing protein [Paenibacillus sp.]|uniref:dihydroneopterin aldolase n=1 Tax=Paenibacillus sp. TaxID=58172 RepID=UPI0025DF6F44|nr:dihydroneopterin aldolase [Paenibacillus sp.]MBR2563450.1 FolB domain-containing protein [Paenibacillus sp.]